MASIEHANPYSRAFFEQAQAASQIETVQQEFEQIALLLKESEALRVLFSSPLIRTENRQQMLDELFASKLNALTLRILKFLAFKRRLNEFTTVAKDFESLYMTYSGIARAEITSASPMAASQQTSLEAKLAQDSGKKINASYKVDPSLIGGFTVKIGDRVIDLSIQNKLEKLKRNIVSE
ncbi:MAG: ATP synthase F1 subunit delta [Lentisphaeria bacterium]|nr:ATP synthase F1 subunit delta [Lentisphaeria bacterium]